jgi:hypothetical protein
VFHERVHAEGRHEGHGPASAEGEDDMSFEVTIIRNSDGARVVVSDDGDFDELSEFRWTEGNQACDCNRARRFAEAHGDPDPWPECTCGKAPAQCACQKPPCGDTLFSVILPAKLQ